MIDDKRYGIETFTAVDKYIAEKLLEHDEVLDDVLRRSQIAALPAINVSPAQGKMLHLLAKIQGAKRILELGTLGGYSTVWLARALPVDGKLITLEFEERHAEVARDSFRAANLEHLIELKMGPANLSLRKMIDDQTQPFDLIFIDADKESYAEYFELAVKLSRPGTQIISDNIVRAGDVLDPDCFDTRVPGVRAFMDKLSQSKFVTSTCIQTVGSKGYDGFALSVVL